MRKLIATTTLALTAALAFAGVVLIVSRKVLADDPLTVYPITAR